MRGGHLAGDPASLTPGASKAAESRNKKRVRKKPDALTY